MASQEEDRKRLMEALNMAEQQGIGRQDFIEHLKTLPDAEQRKLLDDLLADYEGREGQIATQMRRAQELRGGRRPEGRQAGRVYVAANPLEHIASAYDKRRGNEMYDQNQASMGDLIRRRESATRGVSDSIMSGMTPPFNPDAAGPQRAPMANDRMGPPSYAEWLRQMRTAKSGMGY